MSTALKSTRSLVACAARRPLVLRNARTVGSVSHDEKVRTASTAVLTKSYSGDYSVKFKSNSIASPYTSRNYFQAHRVRQALRTNSARHFGTSRAWFDATQQEPPLSQSSSVVTPPSPPPLRGYSLLSNRALIALGGPDVSKFLNGIVTNKVVSYTDSSFDDTLPLYCAFLNAKGRMIADAFIYPVHSNDFIRKQVSPLLPKLTIHNRENKSEGSSSKENVDVEYLIECDKEIAQQLFTTLKFYKLRQDVAMSMVPSSLLQVWSVWDDTNVSQALDFYNPCNTALYSPGIFEKVGYATYPDVRVPGFGLRMLLENKEEKDNTRVTPGDVFSQSVVSAQPELVEAPLVAYDIRRILYGIPEGSKELPLGKALPLENCLDYTNGIHFSKGCYVGQELTIRSHHHGVVRKRVIPVVFYPENKAQATDEGQNGEESQDTDMDLMYNPESFISQHIDTTKSFVGKEIFNEAEPEQGSGDQASSFAPSPFDSPNGKPVTRIRKRKTAAGTVISAVGNIGLALVRLEQFGAPDARLVLSDGKEVGAVEGQEKIGVCGFQPFWWPQPEIEEEV